jgi:uracil-DNA glycosylase
MSEDKRPRPSGPLTDLLAYYRDLGVGELYLSSRVSRAGEEPEEEGERENSSKVKRGVESAEAGETPAVRLAPPTSFTFKENPNTPLPEAAPSSRRASAAELVSLAKEVSSCVTCRLCKTRKQTVFSDGAPDARIMFIGEAPGADEDAQGVPFVGRAGQLLTKMIEDGMGLPRSSVYIANVLKCRPPENRNPEPDEIASCRGYLEKQIDLVKPEVLVALGKFAAQFLLQTEEGIMRLRGKWGRYRGIPVMPTFHPSFLLRQPAQKKEAWEDLLAVLARLDIPAPARKERPS